MHCRRPKRVGVANHGADVEVMFPVLDRDMERMTSTLQFLNDCLVAPVSKLVDHVAGIASFQERFIQSGILWPGQRVRTDSR